MSPASCVATYLAGFTAFAAVRGDRRIVAYLVVLGAAGGGLRLAHRLVPFSRRMQWAVAACGLLHLIGGLVPAPGRGAPVFYETWLVPAVLKFDQLVHFTISAVLTVVAWNVLRAWLRPDRCPPLAHAVLAVLVATGLGAGNEAFEFASALRFADAYVGGLENAGWDLVFNAFGAASAAAFLLSAGPVRSGAVRAGPPPVECWVDAKPPDAPFDAPPAAGRGPGTGAGLAADRLVR